MDTQTGLWMHIFQIDLINLGWQQLQRSLFSFGFLLTGMRQVIKSTQNYKK